MDCYIKRETIFAFTLMQTNLLKIPHDGTIYKMY